MQPRLPPNVAWVIGSQCVINASWGFTPLLRTIRLWSDHLRQVMRGQQSHPLQVLFQLFTHVHISLSICATKERPSKSVPPSVGFIVSRIQRDQGGTVIQTGGGYLEQVLSEAYWDFQCCSHRGQSGYISACGLFTGLSFSPYALLLFVKSCHLDLTCHTLHISQMSDSFFFFCPSCSISSLSFFLSAFALPPAESLFLYKPWQNIKPGDSLQRNVY